MSDSLAEPRSRWSVATWAVCLTLLLASTLNYMDRQTLSNLKTEISTEFHLDNTQYGYVELGFGLAFALGCTVFGFAVDRVNVYWLYPAAMLMWSGAGAGTALARDYPELLIWRILLGFFEAAHWPCALRTTERLLAPADRGFGNSILQSGTSIGAILVPLMIREMAHRPALAGWRTPFLVTGALGVLWLFLWLLQARGINLRSQPAAATENFDRPEPLRDPDFSRRYLVLIGVVVTINIAWHQFRVWMPAFLEEGRGYTADQKLTFSALFNAATDVGCIIAGLATLLMQRWGRSASHARRIVFTGCALCCAASVAIPWLPRGEALEWVLLLIAAGLLGLFPCYYTWAQEISASHTGKIAGTLGTIAWVSTSLVHPLYGMVIDALKTHNQAIIDAGQTPIIGAFDLGLTIAGCLPLGGAAIVWWGWESRIPVVDQSQSDPE